MKRHTIATTVYRVNNRRKHYLKHNKKINQSREGLGPKFFEGPRM